MQYTSEIHWQRNNLAFNPKSYDRTHTLQFPGGHKMNTSSAPEFAGSAELPNPEELFTAALSSCFMLTFLYLAAVKGLVIDDYSAKAIGTLAKNDEGKLAITEVIIKPNIKFQNDQAPNKADLDALFKKAHEQCFISSSVKTKVSVQAETIAA